MKEKDIKELEKQRREIDLKIKQYYDDREQNRIKNNEEKYVGKCYKYEEYGETFYFKILSGLTSNSYCYMHRIIFKLPVNPKFKLNYRMHDISKFDYCFQNDVIEFDKMSIINNSHRNETDKYIEITVEEFEQALEELGKELILVSRDDFTMNGKYFVDV